MIVKDKFNRRFRKLRISLLDACNYRCVYCMPDNVKFCDDNLLSAQKIKKITNSLIPFGISELRLTGGDPCLRKDLIEICSELSDLSLDKLALTTNGHLLGPYIADLAKTNLNYLNISLDSLNRKKFQQISKSDGLEKVLTSIFKAQEHGFKIKINVVVMKGINDNEILDFVDFAIRNKIEVRFLELMKIGVMKHSFDQYFLDASSMINIIKKHYDLTVKDVDLDSTSFNYNVEASSIGFIASESRPFCGNCSRLRLSSKGELRSCLMKEGGISVLEREDIDMAQILQRLINDKPMDRIDSIDQAMYQIGG